MLRYVSRDRNWVLHDRDPVTNWTSGHVTLLGDAAHPTLQYLAQGACMAIEDAVVLAAEVARHGDDLGRAFVAYQQQRMNRTARVVLSARFFGHVCHAGGGARELRNSLLAQRSPDDPWEADWLYRGIQVPEGAAVPATTNTFSIATIRCAFPRSRMVSTASGIPSSLWAQARSGYRSRLDSHAMACARS
jgi:FAD binding domain